MHWEETPQGPEHPGAARNTSQSGSVITDLGHLTKSQNEGERAERKSFNKDCTLPSLNSSNLISGIPSALRKAELAQKTNKQTKKPHLRYNGKNVADISQALSAQVK